MHLIPRAECYCILRIEANSGKAVFNQIWFLGTTEIILTILENMFKEVLIIVEPMSVGTLFSYILVI